MTIGDRIRQARKAKHLSQDDLSILVGCSRVTINNLETGARIGTSFTLIVRLCKKLGVSADWLLGLKKEGDEENV